MSQRGKGKGGRVVRDEPHPTIRSILKQWMGDDSEESSTEVLRKAFAASQNAGAELASILARDPDPRVSQTALVVLISGLMDESVPEHVRKKIADGARPVLLDSVRDPAVADDRKLMLAPACAAVGAELSQEEFMDSFKDFQSAAETMTRRMHDHFTDDPQAVEAAMNIVDELVEDGPDLDEESLENVFGPWLMLGRDNPDTAGALVCAAAASLVERGLTGGMVASFVEALAVFPSPKVSWFLGELGRWPAAGEVAEHADRVAQHMRDNGTIPRYDLLREFSHGHVSMVDGAGSRSVTLFFRTSEGGMDGVVLILNDELGVKDAWCAFEDSSELESAIHGRMADLHYAPCTVALARELLGDAWAIHNELNRPFPGKLFIYRPYFGADLIEPRRRRPNLGAYMPETMVASPRLVEGSAELTEYGPYGGLWFASDAAYRFLKENAPRGRSSRLAKGRLDAFIQQVAAVDLDTLLARMAANLELEAIAGRATQKTNQKAAQTWLALSQKVCPPDQVPYIRRLAELSVPRIMHNLRNGFECQTHANQAEMDGDQAMMELMGQLLDGEKDLDWGR